MIDLDAKESYGEFASKLHGHRYRTEAEIRNALQRMCDAVWGNPVSPAFWHIPVNEETDVDCILYDVFEELKRYRVTYGVLPDRRTVPSKEGQDVG